MVVVSCVVAVDLGYKAFRHLDVLAPLRPAELLPHVQLIQPLIFLSSASKMAAACHAALLPVASLLSCDRLR